MNEPVFKLTDRLNYVRVFTAVTFSAVFCVGCKVVSISGLCSKVAVSKILVPKLSSSLIIRELGLSVKNKLQKSGPFRLALCKTKILKSYYVAMYVW